MIALNPWPSLLRLWEEMGEPAFTLTWQTLGAILGVSTVLVGVFLAYVKVFMRAELLGMKDQIRIEMKEVIEETVRPVAEQIARLEAHQQRSEGRRRSSD